MSLMRFLFLLLISAALASAALQVDRSAVTGGPVTVAQTADGLQVSWRDAQGKEWRAVFNSDEKQPPVGSISVDGAAVVEQLRPFYSVEVGTRSKGWNAFFDFPPAHPDGTQSYALTFEPKRMTARSVGDRVEVAFDGLRLGVFSGELVYTIYPGTRLMQQTAVVSTERPNTAFYYDAGIDFSGAHAAAPGGNMAAEFAWYDTAGKLVRQIENGLQPERIPEKVRYRTMAAAGPSGSVAVFPAPHQYFFPRDFTSNLGYLWRRGRRGRIGLGVRQIRDTNWVYYPWSNAPPGTKQRLSLFALLSPDGPNAAVQDVLRYTHADRFRELEGYKTVSSHWHWAYTVQAMAKGFDWTPPFQPVLEDMGVNASIIMDFHGDGHPRDLTNLRLEELDAFFKACRARSGANFLLIPSEEANVYLGGHWAVVFPHPVYWFMNRPAGGSFEMSRPPYGKVYSVSNAAEMLELVRKENGLMYQTHARTKGSTGYPDKILDTEHFRDDHYFGAGWKALPSDLSSPRLGDRVFTLLDDLSQMGIRKKTMGEVDVFQFDATHELYAHMNINYVKTGRLPDFDHYGELLDPIRAGDFFVTTGEVLLPEVAIKSDGDELRVSAQVDWTLPLAFAEIVWGDGKQVHHERISLEKTGELGAEKFEWKANAPGWKWARLAVWDIAADGAFVNPVWR